MFSILRRGNLGMGRLDDFFKVTWLVLCCGWDSVLFGSLSLNSHRLLHQMAGHFGFLLSSRQEEWKAAEENYHGVVSSRPLVRVVCSVMYETVLAGTWH